VLVAAVSQIVAPPSSLPWWCHRRE
jgi:hypothetical protein